MKLFTAPRALLIFLPGAALVTAGACGYPTFGFEPVGTGTTGMVITGSGGTTASSGGGGGSAATGTGGEATTVTVTATASGTGGGPACVISHAGKKGTCEYLPGMECGCTGAKQKCAVTDPVTGESTCIAIASTAKPKWSGCATDGDCAKGTWCDKIASVCKPICNTGDDCDATQKCIEVLSGGTAIPGLLVCTSHCNLFTPDPPCGSGLTCVFNFDTKVKDTECATTEGILEGATCTASNSCNPGMICVGVDPDYTCEKWCSPADSTIHGSCPISHPFCDPFSPMVTIDGVSYGSCSEP